MKDKQFQDDYFWPLNARALSEHRAGPQLESMKKLVEARERAECLMLVSDDTLSYEYDEYAIVRIDGELYLLQTSGCSCPSPSETWCVALEKTDVPTIRKYFAAGKYVGDTFPDSIMKGVVEALDRLEADPDTTFSAFNGEEDQS